MFKSYKSIICEENVLVDVMFFFIFVLIKSVWLLMWFIMLKGVLYKLMVLSFWVLVNFKAFKVLVVFLFWEIVIKSLLGLFLKLV